MSNYPDSIRYFNLSTLSLFFFINYVVFAITAQQSLSFFSLQNFETIKILSYFFGFTYVFIELFSLKRNLTYFIGSIIVIFALLSSLIVQHELFLGQFLSLIFSIFGAKLINEIKPSNSKYLLIPFWIYFAYIMYALLGNPDPNKVFINSRNWISYYLVIFVVPYYFVKFKEREDFSILPSIITFCLSVYSFGRSGIVASILILGGSLFLYKNKSLFFVFFIPLVLYGIYFVLDFLASANLSREYLIELERFTNFLSDAGRGSMIETYLGLMDAKSIMLGVNQNYFAYLIDSSNFHNSFISLHSVTGFGFFLFIGICLFCLLKLSTLHISLCLIFLAILLRISTDAGALFGYFDFSVWLFIYYCLDLQRNIPTNIQQNKYV